MKLTAILTIVFSLQVMAGTFGQQVSLDVKNASLNKLFREIKKQTGYSFIYTGDMIANAPKISLKVRDQPLAEVLKQCFKNQQLSYAIVNKIIVVQTKAPDPAPKALPVADNAAEDVQAIAITGTILGSGNEPLAGASIAEKGTSNRTMSGENGLFQISVKDRKSVLEISFVGYQGKEVVVGSQTQLVIELTPATNDLGDVVVVAYGTQKKQTVTGSIATVKNEDLTAAPIPSTANTLAGRLPGLVSLQSSGQPGSDAAALSIRGFGGALVIVDGIESSFNNIDANSIETISIMKDGAAAIYGSRAGNGVILVTTKRGKSGKPAITLNSSYTLQGITAMPKPASAGQYAEIQREAWLQSGRPEDLAPFTEEQVQKYYDGSDPLYPNTNWYNQLVRTWAPQHQHNLSVRGGTDRIKYYGFLGYMDQQTMWKKNAGNYQRYNFQSNIDAKITNDLNLQLDVMSIVEDRQFPWRGYGTGGNSAWQDFWNTLPIYPATLPDPSKVSFANGGGTGGAHVVTNSDISGYNNYFSQNIRGTLTLNYNAKAVKGLSAKAFVNYLQDYGYSKSFVKRVNFYTYDPAGDIYTLAGSLGSKAYMNIQNNRNRMITAQFSVSYDRNFGDDHHLTLLGLHEIIDYASDWNSSGRINYLTTAIDQLFAGSTDGMTNNGAASEMGRKGFIGRLNYTFRNKYLLESSIRADASAKFPDANRWGYFPNVSLGWRLNEENFMASVKAIDNLKLRLSYGSSGNDGVGNFQYLSGYAYGNTYVLGPGAQQGLISTGLANPLLTWEKIRIYNAGLDFSAWNRKLYGEFDVFYRERSGIPATRITTLPSSFGANLPPENINSLNNRGFELRIGTSGESKNWTWDVSGNISWTRARWNHYEEPTYSDQEQDRIYRVSGRWTDRRYGYISDGLFTSQEEIDGLKFNQDNQGNISLRPGDVKYVDVNGDGLLDWKDQVQIGKGTTPLWMLGLNGNFKYKNFDLSVLLQGAMGYYTNIVLQQGLLMPAVLYDLRWTPENNDRNAAVPRQGGAATNGLGSDYYYKSAGYLRVKVLSLGYNIPRDILQSVGLQQVRIYAAGTNLFTFDKLKKYGIDPEAPSGNAGYYYPQQRTISMGLIISL